MNKSDKTLVILAAGIGSRFGSGIKQLAHVGPEGECIMEYSVHDALEAGFGRIVFIIRRDIEAFFYQAVGQRIQAMCAARGAEMLCAYQDKNDLPAGFVCPEDRKKPWGTGHALLSCKGMLPGGCVVINADDYYGPEAYRLMARFLDSLPGDSTGHYALAGFLLENTLSENGGVTRGLCRADSTGMLTEVTETRNIGCREGRAVVETPEGLRVLDGKTPVSMNMWAFTPDLLDRLEARFASFLAAGGLENPGAEFLIPIEIGAMLKTGEISVRVAPTAGHWFGMTYAEDTENVRRALAEKTARGEYPSPLF